MFGELTGKSTVVVKAHFGGDFRNTHGRAVYESTGFVNTHFDNVGLWCNTENKFEARFELRILRSTMAANSGMLRVK